MSAKVNKIYNKTNVNVQSDIYIVGSITKPEDYLDEFQTLKEAKEGDIINLYINSSGGNLDTALQFATNIRNCLGLVTAHIEGLCHSAATILFLSANSWVVQPEALMLLHNYSGGAFGKGVDLPLQVNTEHTWICNLMNSYYEGFLLEEEITKLTDTNKDFWLNAEQIATRLQNLTELRSAILVKEEEALRASVIKQLEELQDDSGNTNEIQPSA